MRGLCAVLVQQHTDACHISSMVADALAALCPALCPAPCPATQPSHHSARYAASLTGVLCSSTIAAAGTDRPPLVGEECNTLAAGAQV